MNRDATIVAVEELQYPIAATRRLRCNKDDGLWFSKHLETRKLDRIGKSFASWFQTISFPKMLEFLRIEFFHNDMFVISNRIMQQRRGVAIGGTTSTQLSTIFCMVQEIASYTRPWSGKKADIEEYFPVIDVPLLPFTFLDNLAGLCRRSVDLRPLQEFFENMHIWSSNVRGGGTTWMQWRGTGNGALRRKIVRYPDWYATNNQTTLRSLLPSLALQCLTHVSDEHAVLPNIESVVLEMKVKGYLSTWW